MFQLTKVIIFFLYCSFSLYGQELDVTILNTDDGLNQSTVNDTIKGPYGFYWFATQDGLSRYDGYTFKNFSPKTAPELKSNFFTRIVQFDHLHLLLGTANGLYRLNVLTEELKAVQVHALSGLMISDIQVTSTYIAVVAGDRVFIFNRDFSPYPQQLNPKLAKTGRSLFSFEGNQYYLSAAGKVESLFAIEPLHRVLEEFNQQPDTEALVVSEKLGEVWLGTSNGLWKIDQVQIKKILTDVEVRFLALDEFEHVWLAGKDGIFYGQKQEELTLTRVETGLGEHSSLPTNDLSSLYADSDDIWFGMVSKGVAFHAAKEEWFENYSTKTGKITLPSNDVLSVLPDRGDLWVGTGNGLVHIHKGSTLWLNKTNQPNFYSNRISKVEKDNYGRVWLGFDQGGLVFRDPESDEFKQLPLNSMSISVKDFLVIKDTLYVATVTSGLLAVDVNTGEFKHYHKNSTRKLLTNRIQSIQKGPDNSILIGSFGKGVFQLNPLTDELVSLSEIYEALPETLNSAIIADMKIVGMNLWIATTAGVFQFNLRTQKTLHLDTNSGLPNDLVYTMLFEGDRVWFPTNKGITYYEPDTQFITSYTKREGLINNEYNANAFAVDEEGMLWVGGISGLTAITPKLRPKFDAYLVPKLTEVKLFNRYLKGSDRKQVWQNNHSSPSLFLPAEARMFSLYFSTFQAGRANVVKFRYKLEGFDEQWVVNEAGINFITYTNIDYGEYKLLVSASLDKQNWSAPYEMQITVSPPIWFTVQAKVIYFLVAVLILLLVAYLVWGKLKAEKEAFVKTKINEQKLQFSMHTSGSILWELDLINLEFRMTDYQGDEKKCRVVPLTKEGLTKILHPQDAETLIDMLEDSLNDEVFMKRQYLRFESDDGFTWMKGNSVVSQRSGEGKAELVTGVSYNVNELKRTQLALKELNLELESRVKDRTEKLNVSNAQLQKTLENLQLAQEELIESQKMAALGAMVAGISHEINTPLGVCVTGLSHLNNLVSNVESKLESKSLTQKDLVEFLSTCTESLVLLNKNVDRSAELVKSFKQVSVEQTAEELTQFNLYQLVEDTVNTLQREIREKNIVIEITFDKTLRLISFSSSLSQVIRNLTLNTITHGFSTQKSGKIKISLVDISQEDNEILLIFSDNGSGIEEESLTKVFDPFYTSKRSAGNTGLGLHITYNLVVQKLKGAITVNSLSNTGTEFYIRLPKNLHLEHQKS